jgi:hypothetical protein
VCRRVRAVVCRHQIGLLMEALSQSALLVEMEAVPAELRDECLR